MMMLCGDESASGHCYWSGNPFLLGHLFTGICLSPLLTYLRWLLAGLSLSEKSSTWLLLSPSALSNRAQFYLSPSSLTHSLPLSPSLSLSFTHLPFEQIAYAEECMLSICGCLLFLSYLTEEKSALYNSSHLACLNCSWPLNCWRR